MESNVWDEKEKVLSVFGGGEQEMGEIATKTGSRDLSRNLEVMIHFNEAVNRSTRGVSVSEEE